MKEAMIWSVLCLCLVHTAAAEDWETIIIAQGMQLPLKLEQSFFQLYLTLQQHPMLHVCVFYGAVFYLICKLLCSKATLNVPMAYKVVDERVQSEALGMMATELKKVKKGGEADALQRELDLLLESHHEFQREILESHRDILKELTKSTPNS
jgi:hypothetical protein